MIIPDINWYRSQSKKHNITLRCPYSASDLCPKYAECKSLLEEARCIEPASTTERNRLDVKWRDYQSIIIEDNPGVRPPIEEYDKPEELKKFCPEVTYDNYGYFASQLWQFVDDIDGSSQYLMVTLAGNYVNRRWPC